jgi:hypothetical protein
MYNIRVFHYIGYFPFNVNKIQDATSGRGTAKIVKNIQIRVADWVNKTSLTPPLFLINDLSPGV